MKDKMIVAGVLIGTVVLIGAGLIYEGVKFLAWWRIAFG